MMPIRTGFYILSALILLYSCQSSSSRSGTSSSDTTINYSIAQPEPISNVEKERIRLAAERWYDTALNKNGFNGGMVVAYKGNICFERYNGTIHMPGKDTINASTPMQVASTSKTFTAMAVLKLWEEGKFSLDDEFSKFFPQWNYPGVTVRSLLDHRSGLPNYIYFMEKLGWDKAKLMTNEDVLEWMISKKEEMENVGVPDTHFSYSNTNYALLALLIEKISGKPLPQFLADNFFRPLHMDNTQVYSMPDTLKMNPSYDWKVRLMPLNCLDAVYGDKNVYTTPRDLLKWDQALSRGNIFKEATLQEAYAPYSNEKPGMKNYGLGWRMYLYPDGKKIVFHNGWWHGCNAAFIRLIQDSATIILISNKYNRAVYHSKVLANLFNDFYTIEEDEENSNAEGQVINDTSKVIEKTAKKIIVRKHKR